MRRASAGGGSKEKASTEHRRSKARLVGFTHRPHSSSFLGFIWEFSKIRGTLSWGPYNKDPTIEGTKLGSPMCSETPIFRIL